MEEMTDINKIPLEIRAAMNEKMYKYFFNALLFFAFGSISCMGFAGLSIFYGGWLYIPAVFQLYGAYLGLKYSGASLKLLLSSGNLRITLRQMIDAEKTK